MGALFSQPAAVRFIRPTWDVFATDNEIFIGNAIMDALFVLTFFPNPYGIEASTLIMRDNNVNAIRDYNANAIMVLKDVCDMYKDTKYKLKSSYFEYELEDVRVLYWSAYMTQLYVLVELYEKKQTLDARVYDLILKYGTMIGFDRDSGPSHELGPETIDRLTRDGHWSRHDPNNQSLTLDQDQFDILVKILTTMDLNQTHILNKQEIDPEIVKTTIFDEIERRAPHTEIMQTFYNVFANAIHKRLDKIAVQMLKIMGELQELFTGRLSHQNLQSLIKQDIEPKFHGQAARLSSYSTGTESPRALSPAELREDDFEIV